jgi:hypothetical protein
MRPVSQFLSIEIMTSEKHHNTHFSVYTSYTKITYRKAMILIEYSAEIEALYVLSGSILDNFPELIS